MTSLNLCGMVLQSPPDEPPPPAAGAGLPGKPGLLTTVGTHPAAAPLYPGATGLPRALRTTWSLPLHVWPKTTRGKLRTKAPTAAEVTTLHRPPMQKIETLPEPARTANQKPGGT